jgi:hypothetical protein
MFYVDIRIRANTRGLDFDHMIKQGHTRKVWWYVIHQKNLDSNFCPQRRETKTDILKQLRPIEEGDQEVEKRLVREELT